MDFGLKESVFSIESAEKEYLEVFGKEHLWFLNLAKKIKFLEREYSIKITDILVKDGVILLGVLKNYFDLSDFFADEEIKVDSFKIQSFVKRYWEKRYSEKFFSKSAKEELLAGIFDFAINLYGYGIFRINYSNCVNGPVLNVRVLDFKIPDLIEDLRCPDFYFVFLEKEILQKEKFNFGKIVVEKNRIRRGGLIIHAGETGSGKTTFIASELLFLADRIAGLIVTYEKPVEYRFLFPYSARVIQYDLDFHLSEDEIYRHFLRNSPNVGFFYEVKYREEFVKVVDLASRGHLIFTTVHASDVYEVLSSFGYFNEEIKQMFSSVIRAIVCHKLVTDKNGEIYPLYEIFIKTEDTLPVINMFMKNEFIKLKTYLYKEKGCKSFMSFEDYARSLGKL